MQGFSTPRALPLERKRWGHGSKKPTEGGFHGGEATSLKEGGQGLGPGLPPWQ